MTEREGCALLKELFEAAGLAIAVDVPFAEEGLSLRLDGFDAARRVGFEYITTAAGDRVELGPGVVAALEARMERGDLYLLLVDELDAADAALLGRAADGFLARLRQLGRLP